MKVKCSPSPGAGSSPHSTLKIVDHHHQLQQQHSFTNAGYKSSPPPSLHNVMPPRTYTPNTHHPVGKYPNTNVNTPSCNDCSLGYCCNMATCCVNTPPPPPHYSQTPPQPLPTTHTSPAPTASPFLPNEQYSNSSPCQTVEEPEFVSIDDEKVKQYLIRLGQQQLQKQQQQQPPPQNQMNRPKEPKITHVFSAPTSENTVKPIVYEIIELDDEDEREKLKQIKEQAAQHLASKKLPSDLNINFANRNTKSLDISLIPKNSEGRTINTSQVLSSNSQQQTRRKSSNNTNPADHKIIAEIDLLDSDDEEEPQDRYMQDDNTNDANDEEDDDDTLPLVAVSCELQCDDEDDDDVVINTGAESINNSNMPYVSNNYMNVPSRRTNMSYSKPSVDDVVIIGRHVDKNSDENLMVRWEEYEGQRERVFFECFLCGKKVQSSYNLRRHMMIHTGKSWNFPTVI